MQIIRNQIRIGIEKPFTFFHASDTHLTCTDDADSAARKGLAKERREGLFPYADENLAFLRRRVSDTGFRLVHTGDMVDFITPANLSAAKRFAEETRMLLIAGNHELHHCPNNVFSEADFTVDLGRREETLDEVQKWFFNDIRFFCEGINGVLLVGINNADYQISPDAFEKLRRVVAHEKPILLFMHIPLYCDELYERQKDAMLAAPEEVLHTYRPYQIFEQKANESTERAVAYIRQCPQIRCVISGHLHFNFETDSSSEIRQLITGLDTLREITVM